MRSFLEAPEFISGYDASTQRGVKDFLPLGVTSSGSVPGAIWNEGLVRELAIWFDEVIRELPGRTEDTSEMIKGWLLPSAMSGLLVRKLL